MIEFVIQMSTFQKRFHWMLSALAQQTGAVPDFRLRVDTDANDPFIASNRDLYDAFAGLLDIEWIEHDDDRFARRGFLRNDALKESDADWLLFSDADIVYHPEFMAGLTRYLTGEYDAAMMAVQRDNMDLGPAEAMLATADYSKPIPDAYTRAKATRETAPDGCTAARATGYFQLCRREAALRNGTYTQGHRCVDSPLEKLGGGNCHSDTRFRTGWDVVPVELPPLIHLRHQRAWRNEWDGKGR